MWWCFSFPELLDTVVDCLEELNLTELISSIDEAAGLSSTLADMNAELTVFAPSNAALAGSILDLPSLRAHVLDETVRNSALRSGSVFTPLREDTLLHVTDVHKFHWWRSSEVSPILSTNLIYNLSGLICCFVCWSVVE